MTSESLNLSLSSEQTAEFSQKDLLAAVARIAGGKVSRLALVATLFTTACSAGASAGSPIPDSEPIPRTATLTPEPIESPTPTELTTPVAPESFTAQVDILRDQGFELKEENGIFRYVAQVSGKEVITAKDEGTVVIKTQSGEELEFPQEAFGVKEVAGVGVSAILTLENADGTVEYFYLNHEDNEYWVAPIEGQTNPEVIEDYTQIELEDVWSGRLLYSELLSAEPFPEGTLVPDGFYYFFADGAGNVGKVVQLNDYTHDSQGNWSPSRPFIKADNDFKRWVAFYRSQTPGGQEIVVAAEQVLNTDGESSFFNHFVFGPEWPRERDYKDPYSGEMVNLIDSLFLAKEPALAQNQYAKYSVSPNIFFEANPGFEDVLFVIIRGANRPPLGGKDFYLLEQNNPLLIKEDLLGFIRAGFEGSENIFLRDAGAEIEKLQMMLLLGRIGRLSSDYFETTE